MYKRFFSLTFIILLSAVVLLLVAFLYYPSPQLEVYFFDVGQGDAILVKTPNNQKILIDGGPDNKILQKLGAVLPFYDKKIDLVILTHPHADHLTGLIEVLKRYQVKKVFYTGVLHTTSEFLEWLNLVKDKNIPIKIINRRENIILEPALTLTILYPDIDLSNQRSEELNNTSIVFRLTFEKVSFLMMGDAQKEIEEKLMTSESGLGASVLKVGHHGSRDASSLPFLQKVRPQIAIISAGGDNRFGHPHFRTWRNLEKVGARLYRTDQDGDIKIITSGEKIIVERDK